jgi:hypothetical protein
MRFQFRISRALTINTLATAIGAAAAWNASWIIAYWGVITCACQELLHCIAGSR